MNQIMAGVYQKNIEELPLHRFLGLKIESMGEGEARVTVPVDNQTINPAGNLHGGVVYLVSDVTAFAALGPSLGEGEFAVTIDYHSGIYRGTTSGPVVFQARVASRTRRLAFINVMVTGGDGALLAEARVTKAITHAVPKVFKP